MKTEERSAPSRTTKPKDAEPGFSPEPNLHPQHEEGVRPDGTHCPELDEVLQHGGGDEQAVHQRVGQEEDEELVVGEAHAVVDPGGRGGGGGGCAQNADKMRPRCRGERESRGR